MTAVPRRDCVLNRTALFWGLCALVLPVLCIAAASTTLWATWHAYDTNDPKMNKITVEFGIWRYRIDKCVNTVVSRADVTSAAWTAIEMNRATTALGAISGLVVSGVFVGMATTCRVAPLEMLCGITIALVGVLSCSASAFWAKTIESEVEDLLDGLESPSREMFCDLGCWLQGVDALFSVGLGIIMLIGGAMRLDRPLSWSNSSTSTNSREVENDLLRRAARRDTEEEPKSSQESIVASKLPSEEDASDDAMFPV